MTAEDIPFVDLRAQHAEVNLAVLQDIARVLGDAAFVGGPDVEAFEREFADYCGVEHCVGVANGTDAIELALRAVGVKPADEVIIPANTFIATAEAVARVGAVPVLVDVRADTLLMDAERVSDALTARTRAVVPVHLFGQIADIDQIAAALAGTSIPIVEDAAQSHGAGRGGRRSGALGLVAGTSFYPGKNLGAAGDAGAVTTNDPGVANTIRLLANHGSPVKYRHDLVGFNSRLDTIQAVVLRHKLRRLDDWNTARQHLASRYTARLQDRGDVVVPVVDHVGEPVWHLYVIQVPRRDDVMRAMLDMGVGVGIHYPHPVHLTPAFAWLHRGAGAFPVSESAANRMLSLPMYPHLSERQQDRVIDALEHALDSLPVRR